MIKKIEIAGIHTEITKDIKKYIQKKIAKLDSYMPRHARQSVHVEVKLKETGAKDKKQCMAEVVMYLPGEVIRAKEATINMFAAIDIVEEKLKAQLRRYKTQSVINSSKRSAKIREVFGKIVRKKTPQ